MRARRAALVVIALCTTQDHRTGGGLSPLARGRGMTCQLRRFIISWHSRGSRERATALAVSREEAQHVSLLRARAIPRWL